MKWLNDTSVAAQLVSTNNYDVVRLNDESENYSQTSKTDLKAVKEVGVVDADNLFELGKTYVISLPIRSSFPFLALNSVIYGQSVELVLSSGLATLTVANVDEQGLRIDESFEVSWRVDNNGHLILGHDTAQGVFDVAVLSENDGTTPFVNVQFNTQINGALRHYAKPGSALLKDEDLSWDSASLPGIYRVDSPDNNTLGTQWVELNEDGRYLWVQIHDYNENGRVEFEQGELWLIAGRWQLDDEGDLIVRRYAEKVGGVTYYSCTSDEFEPAIDSTCQVFQQQNWSLYQQKGASSYVSEMRRMYLQEDNQPKIGLAQMKNQRLDKIAQRPVDISAALEW
ncbi:MAG: hypothetical protein MJK04_15440, partial [Psychrosphaera sp.]|nr:hypothetical protein [Psychrosphaera sp.]